MDWRIGTTGFSYADWSGVFYPRSLKPGDYLSHYSQHFNAVELDTTWHATPDAGRVRRWADAVPEDFRFCVKAPRDVTHDRPLDKTLDAMLGFLEVMREMGPKLSVVLLQFPPSFSYEHFEALRALLARLPRDIRYAVELRERSWGRPETLEMLRENNTCLVSAEYSSRPRAILTTTDFLYVRLIGEHGRFATHAEEQIDLTDHLQWWKNAIGTVQPDPRTAYVFLNNDYTGHAIPAANAFKRLLGQSVKPQADEAQQRLFK